MIAFILQIVESFNNDKRIDSSSGIHSAISDVESIQGNNNNHSCKNCLDVNSLGSSNEPRSECSSRLGRPMSEKVCVHCVNSHAINPFAILISKSTIFSQKKTQTELEALFQRDIGTPELLTPPSSFKSGAFSSEDAYLSDQFQGHRIHLPELAETSADSDEIEEEFQSIYTATANAEADADADDSWSENWTLKRRNIRDAGRKTMSPPIGMLVPSPTHDVKTQIGDQNADEISDLSEAGSDAESDGEENSHASIDLPHILVEGKSKIGGRNDVARLEYDLLEVASLVSESSLTHQSTDISEAKNELLLIDAEVAHRERPTFDLNGGIKNSTPFMNGRTNGWHSEDSSIDVFTKFEPIPAPR